MGGGWQWPPPHPGGVGRICGGSSHESSRTGSHSSRAEVKSGTSAVGATPSLPRAAEDRMRTQLPLALLAALAPAAAAQAPATDPHSTFTVGSATARRGEKAFGEIVVPPGVDSGYAIPVAVVHGARPGPVRPLA